MSGKTNVIGRGAFIYNFGLFFILFFLFEEVFVVVVYN